MNPITRIAMGAAIGAIAVLVIHPTSRPYVLAATNVGPSAVAAEATMLPENLPVLPQPKTTLEASLWLQAGATRLTRRLPLSRQNLEALVEIASRAGDQEPSNAYWPQMRAVFAAAAGNEEEAAEAWRQGARSLVWNDYQSARLDEVRRQLIARYGYEQGWQSSKLYFRRSTDCANMINRYGRLALATTGFGTRAELEKRVQCLRNGALLRDGARSVEIGLYGVDLVEASCTLSKRTGPRSPRKLLVARYGLIDALRSAGMQEDVPDVDAAFNANEAWLALLLAEQPQETVSQWSLASVATAALPGSLLLAGIVGYAIAGGGLLLRRFSALLVLVRPPIAPLLGLALAVLVYWATRLPLLAITTVACTSFLAFGPAFERSQPPATLGPLFDFVIATLAVVFSAFLSAFFFGMTTPAQEILPYTSVPQEYFGGQTLPLGLAGLVLGIVMLIAPLWAMAQRIPTSHVITLAFRNFGFDCGTLCLFLGIVAVPTAIYIDTTLTPNLTKLLLNEPIFYMTR